jgi:hypothetical protein
VIFDTNSLNKYYTFAKEKRGGTGLATCTKKKCLLPAERIRKNPSLGRIEININFLGRDKNENQRKKKDEVLKFHLCSCHDLCLRFNDSCLSSSERTRIRSGFHAISS